MVLLFWDPTWNGGTLLMHVSDGLTARDTSFEGGRLIIELRLFFYSETIVAIYACRADTIAPERCQITREPLPLSNTRFDPKNIQPDLKKANPTPKIFFAPSARNRLPLLLSCVACVPKYSLSLLVCVRPPTSHPHP